MAWVRIDDGFDQHPKVWAAGPHAVTLIVRALCWASRNVTDGYLPRTVMPLLIVGIDDPELPGKLVAAGIWERKDDLGFWIHDYLVYNRSKKQVEATRKGAKKRMKEFRARSASVTRPLQRNLPEVLDSPSPTTTKETTTPASIEFIVNDEILHALSQCRLLGAVPRLKTPAFWQAMIRAYRKIDYAAEVLKAEAWLAANPGRPKTDLPRYLANWFKNADSRIDEDST